MLFCNTRIAPVIRKYAALPANAVRFITNMTPSPLPGIYRHYKNDQYYRVHRLVLHTETQERMVLYEGLYNSDTNSEGLWFVRPLAMFIEHIEVNGHSVPRFQRMAQTHTGSTSESVDTDL